MSVADQIRAGDVRAAARLMSDIDDAVPGHREVLKALYASTGKAPLVGVTGSPGAGKSTIVDQLIALYRQRGIPVGVVAVDPSSPFSGGAILGDRIRMQRHATDPGVFIRSLATRGQQGGLSSAAADTARVLEAMGMRIVFLETVGVGQDEVDVARTAQTVVVVTSPGTGDDVQAVKAGLLEIADVFVVNKADRDGADGTARDLEMMLHLGEGGPWTPPIVKTVAHRGDGIAPLDQAISEHQSFLRDTPAGAERLRRRGREELRRIVRDALVEQSLVELAQALDREADKVAAGAIDPYTAAERLIAGLRLAGPG